MNKILVIQTAFLGDVVLATPVVSELKRIYPNSKISFLLKKGNESLLLEYPALDKLYILDKSKGKWKNMFALIKEIRKQQFDLVINLHRFGSSGIIAALSGGKMKYGFKKNPFSVFYTKKFDHSINEGVHEVTRNLSIIHEFGAADICRPSLYPSAIDIEFVNKFKSEEYITAAPASVWFTKQLEKNKWIELLRTKSSKIYLLGAPSDFELCENIRKEVNGNVENLAGKLSLLQSAALMKDAEMNYVNDSGPMHLASAMNAPVTVFYCSTVPKFGFGPLSENYKIAEVQELTCRPCGLHGHKSCPKGHFKCSQDINLKNL